MQYIAFLRGIAPGNPAMRNENLRMVFGKLGYSNVRSVISSGNVLFDSDNKVISELQENIETALFNSLGFHSMTLVRSRQDIRKLLAHNPFGEKQHSSKDYLTVTFIKQKTNFPYKLPYTPENKTYSFIDFFDNTVFSVIDTTTSKTPDLMTWLEKQFTKDITTRTWKTIQRINQKWEQLDTKNSSD
jgi:uncharacterized protein (DUF1697 family)